MNYLKELFRQTTNSKLVLAIKLVSWPVVVGLLIWMIATGGRDSNTFFVVGFVFSIVSLIFQLSYLICFWESLNAKALRICLAPFGYWIALPLLILDALADHIKELEQREESS